LSDVLNEYVSIERARSDYGVVIDSQRLTIDEEATAELRERLREEQRSPPEILVHGEIPERDVADLWEVARAHPIGEPFPFLSLWRPELGRDRLVGTFLAALHLARVQAIELRQDRIAESPLLILRASEERPAPTPEP